MEKCLEIVVHQQLSEYLNNNNNRLIIKQSGFRPNYSCEASLVLTVNINGMNVDNRQYVIAVYLGLKRAFKTTDCEILIKKLESCGIIDSSKMV